MMMMPTYYWVSKIERLGIKCDRCSKRLRLDDVDGVRRLRIFEAPKISSEPNTSTA